MGEMKVSHFSCLIINMNKYECLSYKYYVCNISIKYEYNCTVVWFTYLAFCLTVLSDIFWFFSGYSLFIFFLKYKFIYFNWRLISLQYCIGFAIH